MQIIKSNFSGKQVKLIMQIAFAFLPIAFCIYFIKHEGYELNQSFDLIGQSNLLLMVGAAFITLVYVIVHGFMYKESYKTLHADLPLSSMIILSLKRNFISVFLPAGGISSYAFFTKEIEDRGVSKIRIHLASVVYGISGFASLILIALPAILLLSLKHDLNTNILLAFVLVILLFLLMFLAFRSLIKKGIVFQYFSKHFPGIAILFEDLESEKFSVKHFISCILYSLVIELCGIAHLYIVSQALGFDIQPVTALIGYVVATIMYAISPFMRGLGAVELTLTLTLIQFGMPNVTAISASLLYRFFEFWLPLIVSAGSFIYKRDNFLLRVLPAFLTLLLGVVNIISVLLPGLSERLLLLKDFLPENLLYFSNSSVLAAGIILIVLSAFLIKGLKNAWITAIIIVSISIIGHIVKAIDYEEASFAVIVLFLLIYTRKNYIVKHDKRLFHNAKWYLLGAFAFVLIYGIFGFYFISKRHFNIDFTLGQSILYLFNSLIVVNNGILSPQSEFASRFLQTLNIMGAGLILSTLILAFKPHRYRHQIKEYDIEKGKELVKLYGKSSLDYFKTYFDKALYFGKNGKSFVSFKIENDFAVVLEAPVCENINDIPSLIAEFDEYAASQGLRTLFYRVDEQQLKYFPGKKSIFIGQEGLVNVATFTLEGGDNKPTRNSINKAKAAGYECKIISPPQKEGYLQKLKAVSDDWLKDPGKKESGFTQGVWNKDEIKKQVILTIEDKEEKVVAFANIIPDYFPDEGTYDLIRKSSDAPPGVLDVLMANMIEYFKQMNIKILNLGMAPFSGIEQAKNFRERTIKFAYENLKQFDHFKGLRFFKEKYAYTWNNKYLVYSNDFDLVQAPLIIEKVSRVRKHAAF
jgi:phosphatidylglycerol lysyltransferase